MATRGVIAEKTPDGWRGRYNTWGSHPVELGHALFEAYQMHFKYDLQTMIEFFLRDHPKGFSSVGREWSLPYETVEMPPLLVRDVLNDMIHSNVDGVPRCHCNTDMPTSYTTPTEDEALEWAYVLDKDRKTLTILEHVWSSDKEHYNGLGFARAAESIEWKEIGTFSLEKPEPNWENV